MKKFVVSLLHFVRFRIVSSACLLGLSTLLVSCGKRVKISSRNLSRFCCPQERFHVFVALGSSLKKNDGCNKMIRSVHPSSRTFLSTIGLE